MNINETKEIDHETSKHEDAYRSNMIFPTYSKAQSDLARGKGSNPTSRKVANNTYLIQREGYIAVRLHSTDVVDIHPDKLVLRTGGWMTPTTKDRINRYLPVGWNLYTERRVWWLSHFRGLGEEVTKTRKRKVLGRYVPVGEPGANDNNYSLSPQNYNWEWYDPPQMETYEYKVTPRLSDKWQFKDGISIQQDGWVYDYERSATKMKRRSKLFKEFATEYMSRLSEGKMEAPSASDCFYCYMHEVDTGRPLGDLMGSDLTQSNHMISHLEHKYYVPSIIMNALDELNSSSAARMYVAERFAKTGMEDAYVFGGVVSEQLYRMLVRYVGSKVGLGM